MRLNRPTDTPAPKRTVAADRRGQQQAAKQATLARFATRAKPDPAVAAARQAKLEAQAIREAEKRILRDGEVARVRAEHASRKAAALADTVRIAEEKAQFEADTAMFAAQAAADKVALVTLRKQQRDARYAARASRARAAR